MEPYQSYLSLLGTELETGVQVFPVWGTCLGFEMLAAISCGGCDYRHAEK